MFSRLIHLFLLHFFTFIKSPSMTDALAANWVICVLSFMFS